ncbi:MAG: hypothetical protein QF535_11430, partial [Anaerolineales bacterium]|nr:hypothetical protein [Anaerolineales bacterium]
MRRTGYRKTRKSKTLARPRRTNSKKPSGSKPIDVAWVSLDPSIKRSVVTGCDVRHEWMLPWWYNHYTKYNKCKIYFADFGMSAQMIKWCSAKGGYIDLRWTHRRRQWFKKPFAMLACPAKKVFWIDLDCEIRGSIDPLFAYAGNKLALTLDPHNPWVKHTDCIASGIVGTNHGNKLISTWAERCLTTRLRGDQEVLNELVRDKHRQLVSIMPPEYQWLRLDGENPDALIMHWTGARGKNMIRVSMGLPRLRHRTTSRHRTAQSMKRENLLKKGKAKSLLVERARARKLKKKEAARKLRAKKPKPISIHKRG